MTGSIFFVLLREGSSDDGLVPHLQRLVIEAGADEVAGTVRDHRGTVSAKLAALLNDGVLPDLVFIHRDSDSPDHTVRYQEIVEAAGVHGLEVVVPIVPVQELEAWLLLDEAEIRRVVGRPSGRGSLGLPAAGKVESVSDPKRLLQDALLTASEATGRRRAQIKRDFGRHRGILLARLDLWGGIQTVPAWRRLRSDVERVVSEIIAGP